MTLDQIDVYEVRPRKDHRGVDLISIRQREHLIQVPEKRSAISWSAEF